MVSAFGMRVHPITGETRLHAGADFAAPEGTPILAAADGTVTGAGSVSGYGGLVVIEHTFAGLRVATAYAHMWPPMGIHVRVGDRVRAGQHIGDVGSAGGSTGPHLHFEVRPGGTNGAPIDPVPWLNAHGAANLPAATSGGSSSDCAPNPSTSTPVSKLTGAEMRFAYMAPAAMAGARRAPGLAANCRKRCWRPPDRTISTITKVRISWRSPRRPITGG